MMRKARTLLLQFLLALSACLPHASGAALEDFLGVQIVPFPVTGSTPGEVREFLRWSGPVGEDSRHYDAYTEWEIRWKWPLVDHKPVYEQLQVETKIRVTIPQWSAPAVDMQRAWDMYLDELKQHEAGHVRQALFHAGKIERALKEAVRQDPGLSPHKANAIAKRIIAEARRADEIYDDATAHGRLQGVRWP